MIGVVEGCLKLLPDLGGVIACLDPFGVAGAAGKACDVIGVPDGCDAGILVLQGCRCVMLHHGFPRLWRGEVLGRAWKQRGCAARGGMGYRFERHPFIGSGVRGWGMLGLRCYSLAVSTSGSSANLMRSCGRCGAWHVRQRQPPLRWVPRSVQ